VGARRRRVEGRARLQQPLGNFTAVICQAAQYAIYEPGCAFRAKELRKFNGLIDGTSMEYRRTANPSKPWRIQADRATWRTATSASVPSRYRAQCGGDAEDDLPQIPQFA
jgi:hypothetical protein